MALRVIASRIGGLPEFVREGRTGLLFEPGDAARLAAIMQGSAEWHDDVARSGRCVSRDLAQRHTVDRMVDGYLRPLPASCWHGRRDRGRL